MIIRRSNDRSRDIDLGPVAPYTPRSYGGASGAVTIGEMKPVLQSNGGNFITAGPDKRTMVPSNSKPECGYVLPLAGDRCARAPGHRDAHRSRWVMDNDARMRRASHP